MLVPRSSAGTPFQGPIALARAVLSGLRGDLYGSFFLSEL
jgi:hypothetical protein